jgi:hypothetical protein
MEAILPIIVQIVTGVLGGQAIGAVLQQVAMSQLGTQKKVIYRGALALCHRGRLKHAYGVRLPRPRLRGWAATYPYSPGTS